MLFFSYGQNLSEIIGSVDDNRVMSMIRELSGEVNVEGIGTILDRSNDVGKQKAISYFENKLSEYELTIEKNEFTFSGLNGINILAKQTGVLYPDSLVIICAHYDTVTEYCADDNATGVSAVLETAKIFSEIEFEKTIVYALWDLEENGLYGSKHNAFEAFNNNSKIAAVINSDMIGYDSNSDMLFEIHTRFEHEEDYFYKNIIDIVDGSNLGLNPKGISFGAPNSDHSPFWSYDYPAVLITQGYWSNDFNPNYHSRMDRVDGINEEYVTKIVRVIAGLASEVAVVSNETNIVLSNSNTYIKYDYNSETINIDLSKLGNEIKVSIYDITGSKVISHEYVNNTNINVSNLNNGMYFLKVNDKSNGIFKFFKY